MSFLDLNIALRYRSNEHDFPRDFLIPVLSQTVLYKRAVGFFSSSALIDLSSGISGLIKNSGKIKFISQTRLVYFLSKI